MKIYRLKFEIFVEKEPKNTKEALEILREAISTTPQGYACPEEFIQWKEESYYYSRVVPAYPVCNNKKGIEDWNAHKILLDAFFEVLYDKEARFNNGKWTAALIITRRAAWHVINLKEPY